MKGPPRWRWGLVGGYLAGCAAVLGLAWSQLGMEIFPNVDSGQFQLRLRAATGTRIESTEEIIHKALDIITDDATKTTYTRIPMLSDKWSKSATTSSSEFGNLDIKNAKLIGTETVNGTVCYHLQGTSSSGSSTTGDYWVSQDKYYPVKMSAKTSDGGQFTMTFTGINSGATIDLPADTQVAAS